MAKEVPWNRVIMERFTHLAMLNETEQEILRTRIEGWTRVKQAREFGMSLATLDRYISELKRKYDAVQKYDDILPPRRYSKEEEYMDTAKE